MQKLTTRPEQERREFQKAGKNRGGLLQSDSLALWQNAPEPMDQNRTQTLPSHRTARRSLRSQHPSSGLRLYRKQEQMFATGLPKLLKRSNDQPRLCLQRSGMLLLSHHPDGPMCAHCFKHRILTR